MGPKLRHPAITYNSPGCTMPDRECSTVRFRGGMPREQRERNHANQPMEERADHVTSYEISWNSTPNGSLDTDT
jgi:hypothetical protein